jgi:hypothetical protein
MMVSKRQLALVGMIFVSGLIGVAGYVGYFRPQSKLESLFQQQRCDELFTTVREVFNSPGSDERMAWMKQVRVCNCRKDLPVLKQQLAVLHQQGKYDEISRLGAPCAAIESDVASLVASAATSAEAAKKEEAARIRSVLVARRDAVIKQADAARTEPKRVLTLLADFHSLNDPEINQRVSVASAALQQQVHAHAERVREGLERQELQHRKKQGVSVGMTATRVLQSSWGKPGHVNRTTTALGVTEQWVYGGRSYLYFTDGILTAIQN